jgi:serine/threonine protein kinase
MSSLPILKLTDFGLAHMLANRPMTTYCGTPLYIAPEVFHLHLTRHASKEADAAGVGQQAAAAVAAAAPTTRAGYGAEVDLWSAGVILFQLLCDGTIPFTSQAQILRGMQGSSALGLRFPQNISPNAIGLVNMLLTKPNERLNATTSTEHAWFEEFRADHTPKDKGMSRAPTLPLGQSAKRQRLR